MKSRYLEFKNGKVVLCAELKDPYGCKQQNHKGNERMIFYDVEIKATFDSDGDERIYYTTENASNAMIAAQKGLISLSEKGLDEKTPMSLDVFENGAKLTIEVTAQADD